MENSPLNNLSTKLDKWSHIATIVMAFTAVVGLVYVYCQLDLFREQTETLNRSLIQSYRPIGAVKLIASDNSGRIPFHNLETGKKEKWSFQCSPTLTNKGNGPLIFIGHIYYLSVVDFGFRDSLLSHKINVKDVKTDGIHEYSRGVAFLPNDNVAELFIRYDDVDFENYFLYILVLYEDQDGNLYDTVVKYHFEHGEPKLVGDRFMAEVENLLQTNKFNSYTRDEKKELVKFFKAKEHSMYKYFSE